MRTAFVVAVVVFIQPFAHVWAGEWSRCYSGKAGISSILVVPRGEKLEEVYAGTEDGGVVVSEDGGKSWKYSRCVSGYGGRVRALCYDAGSRCVFAAAENGIYRRDASGTAWRQVFKTGGAAACTALQATPEGIYAATVSGVLLSPEGKVWHRQNTGFTPIALSYDASSSRLFAVSADALYGMTIPGGAWKRLFTVPALETDVVTDGEGEAGDEQLASSAALSAGAAGTRVAAFGNRVVCSGDGGRSWERLPSTGISGGITGLLCSRERVFAVSKREVRVYDGDRWSDLSDGLAGAKVNGLAGGRSALFAATDTGIFTRLVGGDPVSSLRFLSPVTRYVSDEPEVTEVQKAAVEYADAGGEKIIAWHKQAQRKAWLPHFAVGFDRETGDLWHWESGSSVNAGDDCLRKGKDAVNWNVSLIWELGDLVWNQDQTGIDTRSRMNAELRADVIDEVTKLYFERIHLKMEIDSLSLEEGSKRGEKQLKLEETTALLDGLTGGRYSFLRRIKEPKIACK